MLRIEDCEISSETVPTDDGAATFTRYNFPGQRVCVLGGGRHFHPSYPRPDGTLGPMPFMVLHDLDAAVAALNDLLGTAALAEWTRTVDRGVRKNEIVEDDRLFVAMVTMSGVFLEIARRHGMCRGCTAEAVLLYEAARKHGGAP